MEKRSKPQLTNFNAALWKRISQHYSDVLIYSAIWCLSRSPRQCANLSRTGGPANSSRLIFPKHKRLIPLFFTEGVRAQKQERKNEKSNNKREVKLVFGESELGSKIRYPDPEVTLIRDNKKMSDFCVQDRKRALSKGSRHSFWQTQSHPTKETLYLKRKKEGKLFSSSF